MKLRNIFFGSGLVALAVVYSAPYAQAASGDAFGCALGGITGIGGYEAGIDCANAASGLEDTKVYNIIQALMLWMLGLVGLLAVIGFVIAGMLYLTAAGDSDQIDRAKKTLRHSIIGIIIALSGVIIITAINAMLNADKQF